MGKEEEGGDGKSHEECVDKKKRKMEVGGRLELEDEEEE